MLITICLSSYKHPNISFCSHLEMAEEFKKLLNRNDLPAMIVEIDTTFDMGNYYITWITFRVTDFYDLETSPMPTAGLACFIHSKKLQA